jgi:Uma2 family endonuclease
MQAALGSYFFARRKAWNIEVYAQQRVQLRADRVRVPDLCVVLGGTKERIFTVPPFLCVEILSPDDLMIELFTRLNDYFKMGVPNVWVIDPQTRLAHIASPSGDLHRVTDFLRTTDPILEVPLSEIFE